MIIHFLDNAVVGEVGTFQTYVPAKVGTGFDRAEKVTGKVTAKGEEMIRAYGCGSTWREIEIAPVVWGHEATPTETPWGRPDHSRPIAPGIVHYGTPSHGGIWLAKDRFDAVKRRFPSLQLWAGDQWFEEDCDWAIVALVFPEFFRPQDIDAAKKTVCAFHPKVWAEYIA